MKYAIQLTDRQSARILDAAVRAAAGVCLELVGGNLPAGAGRLVSADDAVVLVSLSAPLPLSGAALIGRYAEIQIFADQRYFFSSPVVHATPADRPYELAVRRPTALQVLQRRRFWRARVAPSSHVRIRPARWREEKFVNAALLNLSSDGLACQTEAETAEDLYVGDAISVWIAAPDAPRPFEFSATVCNKAPGADQKVIIGIQFVIDAENAADCAARLALRRWLYDYEPAATTGAGA